mgnify:FL=1
MIDKKVIYKLTHGMYVLTTEDAGCFVDAVSQVGGGDQPLISVAVMKKNFTNESMHKNDRFALAIFGDKDDASLIKTYGFNSSRDYDKFANSHVIEVGGTKVVDTTLGYIILEKIDAIENDTHTIFIGRVIESKMNDASKEPMTYGYYQAHKDELLTPVKTTKGKTAWVCTICGYIEYDLKELPDDYICPVCGADKTSFELKEV